MSLKRLSQSVKSENADKAPCLGSGLSSEKITDLMRNKFSLEQPTVPLSGEGRYLTPLWVSRNEEPRDEVRQTDSSDSKTIIGFELGIDNNDNEHTQRMLQDKIRVVLKLLTFRKQRVIVQFWSPLFVGKKQLLTTIDQPFGIGVIEGELCFYRKDSECILYVVDKDHDIEEDISPPARVFKQGFPEWTSDIANYLPKHFAQQECAIRCNLHGYLALPVFDSVTRSCVGVIEFLTSSKYTSLAYEAEKVQKALQTQNLTCLQLLDDGPSNVSSELRLNELEKISSILKVVCDAHKLPLAQTWAISPLSTLASHEQILKKKCGSFDTKCLGKVCMSTASLPYYVPDLGMWSFRKACREQHLDKYHGLVGRALLSRGSCFCDDVTKLGEEEYPLVHNAHMSGLTSCFAIFLHSVEGNHDYVLEFFLPLNIKDVRHVQLNLVQTLMQHIGVASGFELGENSHIEVVKPLMDLPAKIEPDIVSTTSYMNVPDECSSTNVSMEIICATFADNGETISPLKNDNKRKRGSDTMVLVKAIYENTIKEFLFVTSLGLLKLKNEVAKQFKLNGNMIRLKYWDEENEMILICVDDDLKLALVTSEVNNSINLVCELSA